jgi:hypothetical protein
MRKQVQELASLTGLNPEKVENIVLYQEKREKGTRQILGKNNRSNVSFVSYSNFRQSPIEHDGINDLLSKDPQTERLDEITLRKAIDLVYQEYKSLAEYPQYFYQALCIYLENKGYKNMPKYNEEIGDSISLMLNVERKDLSKKSGVKFVRLHDLHERDIPYIDEKNRMLIEHLLLPQLPKYENIIPRNKDPTGDKSLMLHYVFESRGLL